MPLVWPLTRLAFCVWFEVKWNFYCRRCTVIYPTPETFLTTRLVTNFSGSITKDSFPSTPPNFLLIRYNFIEVLQISALHEIEAVYQFYSSTNPMESSYPPLPSLLAPNTLPLLWACEQAFCLGKGWKNHEVFLTLFPKRRACSKANKRGKGLAAGGEGRGG